MSRPSSSSNDDDDSDENNEECHAPRVNVPSRLNNESETAARNYVHELCSDDQSNYICQKAESARPVRDTESPYLVLRLTSYFTLREPASPFVATKGTFDSMNLYSRDAYSMTLCISRNLIVTLGFFAALVGCNPKFDDGGFVPSSISYMEKHGKAEDQIAMPSSQIKHRDDTPKRESETNDIIDRNQEARFGFTNIGGTGSGYGVSPYAPAKIDLGGLLLGAIIGVGSILIIPKLLYVLSGTYGTYARSEDSSFTQTLTRIDDVLARHGIDTTSCMQRAVCMYSQQAATAVGEETVNENDQEEKTSSFDKMVNAITTNQVFRTAMQGTAIAEAVEAGRAGRSCSRAYQHCGFSMETILSLLANVIAAANTRVPTPTGSSSL